MTTERMPADNTGLAKVACQRSKPTHKSHLRQAQKR